MSNPVSELFVPPPASGSVEVPLAAESAAQRLERKSPRRERKLSLWPAGTDGPKSDGRAAARAGAKARVVARRRGGRRRHGDLEDMAVTPGSGLAGDASVGGAAPI